MKKILLMFLCLVLLLSGSDYPAFAEGEGNMDSGGSGMGNGSSDSYWNSGNDGVRVTVIRASNGTAVSTPVDFSNKTFSSSIVHFGKVSKLQYRSGQSLSPSGTDYTSRTPQVAMPCIVSADGSSTIEAVKSYFCSEYAAIMVADATGINYDMLINGEYKLIVEPIAYFMFNGTMYCMTATEAALYDQLASGGLRAKMLSLSHKNLPLSIFLQYSDLGFAAWSGSTTTPASNTDIINYLGIGIVKYRESTDTGGGIHAPDYEYRVDTDVISSITLRAGSRITPDRPASVTFYISGLTYTVNNIVIPAGESQVVWAKWHTPSTPQTITIRASVSGAYTAQDTFTAKIVDLNGNTPPDPKASDTNPGYTVPSLPANAQKTYASWGVWSCHWKPDWRWVSDWEWESDGESGGSWVDNGEWVDFGDWEYDYTGYSAGLSGSMSLMPDDIVPTANGKNMKSGYGVKTTVSTVLSTDAPSSHFTYAQTAVSYFPEFRYNTYLRLLERTIGGRNAKFQFKANPFSTYNRNVHFSPVWFPDGKRYTVYTQVWDTWTPDGMLSINVDDYVSIQGSLFDDWYTNRE